MSTGTRNRLLTALVWIAVVVLIVLVAEFISRPDEGAGAITSP